MDNRNLKFYTNIMTHKKSTVIQKYNEKGKYLKNTSENSANKFKKSKILSQNKKISYKHEENALARNLQDYNVTENITFEIKNYPHNFSSNTLKIHDNKVERKKLFSQERKRSGRTIKMNNTRCTTVFPSDAGRLVDYSSSFAEDLLKKNQYERMNTKSNSPSNTPSLSNRIKEIFTKYGIKKESEETLDFDMTNFNIENIPSLSDSNMQDFSSNYRFVGQGSLYNLSNSETKIILDENESGKSYLKPENSLLLEIESIAKSLVDHLSQKSILSGLEDHSIESSHENRQTILNDEKSNTLDLEKNEVVLKNRSTDKFSFDRLSHKNEKDQKKEQNQENEKKAQKSHSFDSIYGKEGNQQLDDGKSPLEFEANEQVSQNGSKDSFSSISQEERQHKESGRNESPSITKKPATSNHDLMNEDLDKFYGREEYRRSYDEKSHLLDFGADEFVSHNGSTDEYPFSYTSQEKEQYQVNRRNAYESPSIAEEPASDYDLINENLFHSFNRREKQQRLDDKKSPTSDFETDEFFSQNGSAHEHLFNRTPQKKRQHRRNGKNSYELYSITEEPTLKDDSTNESLIDSSYGKENQKHFDNEEIVFKEEDSFGSFFQKKASDKFGGRKLRKSSPTAEKSVFKDDTRDEHLFSSSTLKKKEPSKMGKRKSKKPPPITKNLDLVDEGSFGSFSQRKGQTRLRIDKSHTLDFKTDQFVSRKGSTDKLPVSRLSQEKGQSQLSEKKALNNKNNQSVERKTKKELRFNKKVSVLKDRSIEKSEKLSQGKDQIQLNDVYVPQKCSLGECPLTSLTRKNVSSKLSKKKANKSRSTTEESVLKGDSINKIRMSLSQKKRLKQSNKTSSKKSYSVPDLVKNTSERKNHMKSKELRSKNSDPINGKFITNEFWSAEETWKEKIIKQMQSNIKIDELLELIEICLNEESAKY